MIKINDKYSFKKLPLCWELTKKTKSISKKGKHKGKEVTNIEQNYYATLEQLLCAALDIQLSDKSIKRLLASLDNAKQEIIDAVEKMEGKT